MVHAAANVYGAGAGQLGGSAQQVIDVLNGDITLGQLVAGQDIKDYVFAT